VMALESLAFATSREVINITGPEFSACGNWRNGFGERLGRRFDSKERKRVTPY